MHSIFRLLTPLLFLLTFLLPVCTGNVQAEEAALDTSVETILDPQGLPNAQNTVERILVIVNDEIITSTDLQQLLTPLEARMRATLTGDELEAKLKQAHDGILQQLINERLVLSEARATNIKVEEKEVDEMMADMRKKFPTQEAFERLLREQGLSTKKLRERFHDDILRRRMIDYKVRSRISVSPGEIRDFYTEHKAEFLKGSEAKVRQILVRAGDTRTDEEAKAIAQDIVKQIDGGADMERLAILNSEGSEAKDGGAMGWVRQGQFMERLDRAIFKLKPGEHTEPVKTQLGYHIFRMEDFREAKEKDFEEVKDDVEDVIYKQKFEEILKDWLQSLRDNAYISHQSS